MTVSSELNRKQYTGNGVTTSFATSPVVFFDTSDLVVYVVTTATGAATTLTEDTHYTVSGGSGSTGTVSLAGGSNPYGAPASTQTLVIVRNVPLTQATDFVQNDSSDAEVTEDAFDKLTMAIQQVDARVDRSFVLPDSDVSGASPTVPTPSANKLIGWNSAATALENKTPADIDLTVVTAFIETLLDDATAAAARSTLGLGTAAVEPTTTFWSTGDVKLTLKTAADSGWVLFDDGTIGNASSGGTSRANADTEALFTLLWTNTADAQCAVSTGRGASAAADYAANKTIALPKALGRALAASGAGSGLTSRALALATGTETHTLLVGETPVKSHVHVQQGTFTSGNASATGISGTTYDTAVGTANGSLVGGGTGGTFNGSITINTDAHTHQTTISGNTAALEDTTATGHNNMQPTLFLNVMIKL